MPTENRSSNTEMVSVQATIEALEEAYAGDGALEFMNDAAQLLRQFQAQPAQHQGEPVALPERKGRHLRYDTLMPAFWKGWNACLDEIAKLGPLYTHPAPAEQQGYPSEDELIANGLGYPISKEDAVKLHYAGVRSPVITVLEAWEAIGHDTGINPDKQELMDSLRNMAAICAAHGFDMPADPGEVERLRAELAERDALLREADEFMYIMTAHDGHAKLAHRYGKDWWDAIDKLRGKVCTAISASAEPVAPVERDERAAFEADWAERHGIVTDVGARNSFYRIQPLGRYRWPDVQNGWDSWQARAALERKPSCWRCNQPL